MCISETVTRQLAVITALPALAEERETDAMVCATDQTSAIPRGTEPSPSWGATDAPLYRHQSDDAEESGCHQVEARG